MLTENLGHYLHLYDTWSGYRPEEAGVLVAYASIYGNTAEAAKLLAQKLAEKGETVRLLDLARCDMALAVSEAFRYDRLAVAAATYNGDVFPFMRTFLQGLTARNYQNRTVAFLENGTWAPQAAKVMGKILESSKNLTFCEPTVTIRSALNEESRAQIDALADNLAGKK